jgi:hypothetical protein
MPYEFDGHEYPLVRMRLREWLDESDWDRFYADFTELLEGGAPFAAVLDTVSLRAPEIRQLRGLAAWIQNHQEPLGRLHRGCACVIDSPMIRGTLKAVVHMQPMPMPMAVFEGAAEANAWARERVADLLPQADPKVAS